MSLYTGFLNGINAIIAPDGDVERISTNIAAPRRDYFSPIATGALYPGAEAVLQGGYSSYYVPESQTTLTYQLRLRDRPDALSAACMANCTMGGCTDPTSTVHTVCQRMGCCTPPPLSSYNSYNSNGSKEPVDNSQTAYVSNDCMAPEQYCGNDLSYFNCHPWATAREQLEDPACAYLRRLPTDGVPVRMMAGMNSRRI